MQNLNKTDIENIAFLAKVKLSQSEITQYYKEFCSIIDYIKKINLIDTKGVEPTYQVNSLDNILAEDVKRDCPKKIQKRIISNFPDKQGALLKVPPIL